MRNQGRGWLSEQELDDAQARRDEVAALIAKSRETRRRTERLLQQLGATARLPRR